MSNKLEPLIVDLGERSYPIHVGGGLIDQAGPLIKPVLRQSRVYIVTDANVAPLYLERLQASLDGAGIAHDNMVLPAGERTKSFKFLEALLEDMLEKKCERSTTLIALGGGVVGDLTGFAAAVLLRGVDFVQIPTTLLSQVDSSVGGKTGINTSHGKNLVGSFHQPLMVLADIETLNTLPRRDLAAGYAEVAKYGLIDEPEFFVWLEENAGALLDGDEDLRRHAVLTSCKAKARVVAADERESGQRALLNLGHTFGHAFEFDVGYGGALLHGEAVSLGMVLAFDLSARTGLCAQADADRARVHLQSLGLPTKPSDIREGGWDASALLSHMDRDKKVQDGKVTFVVAKGIGQSFLSRDVDKADVLAVLEAAIDD